MPPDAPIIDSVPAPDLAAELAAARAEIAALKAAPAPSPEQDLNEKARLAREAQDKSKGNERSLEQALRFSLNSKEFLTKNGSLLPPDVSDLFVQSEKETYSSAIEKDAALKSGIIQSFFAVQANVDLLTPGVKAVLDDYLKLTKTGKQDRAQAIYDTVFEPTFESLKKIKKAEALSKGYGGGTDAEDSYKKKMIELSKKHYQGDRRNGA